MTAIYSLMYRLLMMRNSSASPKTTLRFCLLATLVLVLNSPVSCFVNAAFGSAFASGTAAGDDGASAGAFERASGESGSVAGLGKSLRDFSGEQAMREFPRKQVTERFIRSCRLLLSEHPKESKICSAFGVN